MEHKMEHKRDRESSTFGPRTPKTCRFCEDKELRIDYKDGKAFRPFLTERDKIHPRRQTGLCAFHQREMTRAIKRARHLGILCFVAAQRESV